MESKHTIAILIISILIVVIIISFIFLPNFPLSPPSSSDLVSCNTLSYSSENAINLLFYADKETVQEYKEEFSKISPLKENKEKFNFYYIDSYSPSCKLYKGIAIFCHSKSLIQVSSSCPNDYIIVINDDHQSSLRSSSYMNVLSINKKHSPNVLHHEFGHSFASLAEEYIPANIPKASKNCVSDCSDFNNLEDGCFQDCSDSNHYRSIDKGIMRTLKSNNFGNFNSYLLSEKIRIETGDSVFSPIKAITTQAVSTSKECQDSYYLLLTISPDFSIKNKEILNGCVTGTGSGNLEYQILDSQNNLIETSEFDLTVFTDVELNEELSGEVFQYDSELYLPIPILDNSETLIIQDKNNNELLSTSLSNLNYYPCKK